MLTKVRTRIHEEISLLTVPYFPFRARTPSKLIELRQTVVHGGQMTFPDFYILREYIRDVARGCLVLIDSTAEVSTDTAGP